jgi:uncharacterized protein (TIGR02391 family)
VVTIRHGDEYVPAADVEVLPLPSLALRLLVDLDRRRTAHPAEVAFGLDWIVRNARVRWEEDGVAGAPQLTDKIPDALAWLVSEALLAPTAEPGVWRISELGRELAARQDLGALSAERRLGVELHPSLSNARSIFSLGTYDAAVLEAMKQVEERVRSLSGLTGSGADLMRRAFSPGGSTSAAGPLADPSAPDPNENRGVMDLFAGAMGAFRNPAAHRSVDYDHPTEAAELILLADLLLRILNRAEART